MKKLLFILVGLVLGLGTTVYGASTLFPYQGGTGIGSATAGQIGTCLKVLTASPFVYELGTCGSGGGTDSNWSFFNTSGIRLATTTNSVLIGATATSTRSQLEVNAQAGITPFYVGSSTPYFIVGSTGNVGIGTTSPGSKLDVYSTGDTTLSISADIQSGSSNMANLAFKRSDNAVTSAKISSVAEIAADYSRLGFYTTGASGLLERMRIDSSGNVGIGTAVPTQKLEVNGTIQIMDNGVRGLSFANNTQNSVWHTTLTNGSTDLNFAETGVANARLYLKAGGNVGIGTTTPAWKTQIAGTRPDFALSDSAGGTNAKHIVFSNRTGNLYIGAATDLYATSTPALTVLSGGNIGIGTSSPFTSLGVAGTIIANNINATSTTATSIFSGIVQVITRFIGVISATFTPTAEGEVGIDTTSNQFKYYASSGVRVIAPDIDSAFLLASSSMGIGTTTLKTAGFSRATTFAKFGCSSRGSGTFVARIGNSTASSTSVVSATGNTTTFTTLSSNNSFTSGQAIWYEIGSVSGTVIDPTCGYNRTTDAD